MFTFRTEAQTAAYNEVGSMLREYYGETVWASDDAPTYWISYGSAAVGITVHDRGDSEAYLRIFSWVLYGPRDEEDLARFLVQTNAKMRIGAFAIDAAGDIEFAYGLTGDGLTKSRLCDAVTTVVITADEWDDTLQARFGGLRHLDKVRAMSVPVDFERALDQAGLRLQVDGEA